MGVRQRRGAPTWYRPGAVFFNAGMLVIFTFGMMLAAIDETYLAKDWIWFALFVAGATGCVVLYFLIVASWLRWMGGPDDFTAVDDAHHPSVDCWQGCGHDHRHGDY